MKFFDALEEMKLGKTIEHAGKRFRLIAHGVHDVTDEENPERVNLTPKKWDALDVESDS